MIREQDAANSTAAEFNTINSATTVAIDASEVTALVTSDLSDVKTLLTAANDTDQFTDSTGKVSFGGLTAVAIADATINVSDFNAAVTQANTATGKTTAADGGGATVFTLASAATYSGGTAADFATLITNEGKDLISGGITNEALTVDSGTIAVSAVNDLNTTTTGVVTATITEGDMTTLASLADKEVGQSTANAYTCLLYTSPSPRDH